MKKIILIIGSIQKEPILDRKELVIARDHHLGAKLIEILIRIDTKLKKLIYYEKKKPNDYIEF